MLQLTYHQETDVEVHRLSFSWVVRDFRCFRDHACLAALPYMQNFIESREFGSAEAGRWYLMLYPSGETASLKDLTGVPMAGSSAESNGVLIKIVSLNKQSVTARATLCLLDATGQPIPETQRAFDSFKWFQTSLYYNSITLCTEDEVEDFLALLPRDTFRLRCDLEVCTAIRDVPDYLRVTREEAEATLLENQLKSLAMEPASRDVAVYLAGETSDKSSTSESVEEPTDAASSSADSDASSSPFIQLAKTARRTARSPTAQKWSAKRCDATVVAKPRITAITPTAAEGASYRRLKQLDTPTTELGDATQSPAGYWLMDSLESAKGITPGDSLVCSPKCENGLPELELASVLLKALPTNNTSGYRSEVNAAAGNQHREQHKQNEGSLSSGTADTHPYPVMASRFVLCARSPVLRAMLATAFAESHANSIHLSDMTFETLTNFVDYLHRDTCPLFTTPVQAGAGREPDWGPPGEIRHVTRVIDLFKAADKYDCQSLRLHCLQWLTHHLNPANCLLILGVAVQWKLPSLQFACYRLLQQLTLELGCREKE